MGGYRNKEKGDMDKETIVCVTILIISLLVLAYSVQGYNAKKDVYKERLAKVTMIEKENKEIEKKERTQKKALGIENVTRQTNQFYNLFYNWNSWQKYTENMYQIQKDYPQLKGNSPVDISGNVVGTGDSPISRYEVSYYITNEKEQVVSMVKQTRNTATTSTISTWRGITKIDDKGLLNIVDLSTYSKIN